MSCEDEIVTGNSVMMSPTLRFTIYGCRFCPICNIVTEDSDKEKEEMSFVKPFQIVAIPGQLPC